MEKFKFIRRKCNIERYNRAKKLIAQITFPMLRKELEEEIEKYDTMSELIKIFTNHPELEEKVSSNGKKYYYLPMRFVTSIDGVAKIVDGSITCSLHAENYAESWRNIGADYHALYFDDRSPRNGYWLGTKKILEQIRNQDKLEDICKQENLLKKNYF